MPMFVRPIIETDNQNLRMGLQKIDTRIFTFWAITSVIIELQKPTIRHFNRLYLSNSIYLIRYTSKAEPIYL